MASSANSFFIMFILIIAPSSSDGRHWSNQESVQALRLKCAPNIAENIFDVQVKIFHKNPPPYVHRKYTQESQSIKNKQQLVVSDLKPQQIGKSQPKITNKNPKAQYEQTTHVINAHEQLPSNLIAKKANEYLEVPQTHAPESENRQLKDQTLMEMEENQRTYLESSVPSLWKRADNTKAAKLDKGLSEPASSRKSSRHPSKIMKGIHSIAKTMVNAPQKIKLRRSITRLISNPKKALGSSKKATYSEDDYGGQFTSGYAPKPSGLIPTKTDEYPAKKLAPTYSEIGLPTKQTTDQEKEYGQSPQPSPMKTPEVNQIWDYINRHSKEWADQAKNDKLKAAHPKKSKSQENKEAAEYIAMQRKEWASQRSPGREGNLRFLALPPSTTKPVSPSRSLPRSVTRSPPRSPTSLPTTVHSSTLEGRPPQRTRPHLSETQLRQPSNKEIDDEFQAMAKRVRSVDRSKLESQD